MHAILGCPPFTLHAYHLWQGGDLYQLLEAKGRLPEAWVLVYAAEVCLALEHVHDHDIIFRDRMHLQWPLHHLITAS